MFPHCSNPSNSLSSSQLKTYCGEKKTPKDTSPSPLDRDRHANTNTQTIYRRRGWHSHPIILQKHTAKQLLCSKISQKIAAILYLIELYYAKRAKQVSVPIFWLLVSIIQAQDGDLRQYSPYVLEFHDRKLLCQESLNPVRCSGTGRRFPRERVMFFCMEEQATRKVRDGLIDKYDFACLARFPSTGGRQYIWDLESGYCVNSGGRRHKLSA